MAQDMKFWMFHYKTIWCPHIVGYKLIKCKDMIVLVVFMLIMHKILEEILNCSNQKNVLIGIKLNKSKDMIKEVVPIRKTALIVMDGKNTNIIH